MQAVLRAALAFHGFKALSKCTRIAAQLLQDAQKDRRAEEHNALT